jgi:hypothetical protein
MNLFAEFLPFRYDDHLLVFVISSVCVKLLYVLYVLEIGRIATEVDGTR